MDIKNREQEIMDSFKSAFDKHPELSRLSWVKAEKGNHDQQHSTLISIPAESVDNPVDEWYFLNSLAEKLYPFQSRRIEYFTEHPISFVLDERGNALSLYDSRNEFCFRPICLYRVM